MKRNAITIAVLSAAIVAAPISSAWARGGNWHHGRGIGPLGLIGAVVVGAVAIATLPFRALADAAGRERGYRDSYAPPDNYYRGRYAGEQRDYEGDARDVYPRASSDRRSYDDRYAGERRYDRGDDARYADPRAYADRRDYRDGGRDDYNSPPSAYDRPRRLRDAPPPDDGAPNGDAGPPQNYDGPPPGYDEPRQ